MTASESEYTAGMATLKRRLRLLSDLDRQIRSGLAARNGRESASPRSEDLIEKTLIGTPTSSTSGTAMAFDFELYVEQWEAEGRPFRTGPPMDPDYRMMFRGRDGRWHL
jgi:hypothetical protein